MHIVIVHSHLNPGGVTRIIESQIKALSHLPITILTGSCPNPDDFYAPNVQLEIIPELNYLERKKYNNKEVQSLHKRIKEQLSAHLKKDSILHIHNLNLGKNPVVTYAVYQLAKQGVRIFNHAHDFAEDRPSNFQFLKDVISGLFDEKLESVLYPDLPNVHFGVLNSFDHQRLIEFGISKERIVWLPNPVALSAELKHTSKEDAKNIACKALDLSPEKLLVTYPVRVIQRKNIGEFILLSLLFKNKAQFTVTQPPKNPAEIILYEQWVKFCRDNEIPIVFEAGNKIDFETLIFGSDFCITTSYKEGFGMAYLEPWLFETPVVGRNIDFLTRDFQEDGLRFPSLYYKIIFPGTKIDFADLNMHVQMQLITQLLRKNTSEHTIFEQNPILRTLFSKIPQEIIDNNKTLIENKYSIKGYGIKLQQQYRKLAE